MFKNLSFLALASVMTLAMTTSACILVTDAGTGDGDGDTGDGDGDTDSTSTGDGDGDTDDTSTGDGDGDPTGDGDGDDTTGDGDGDGDTTGPAGSCGWIADQEYYGCGGEGEDPNGAPIGCPDGLVAGEACDSVDPALTGDGCCDAGGNNWFCGEDEMMNIFIVEEVCE